MAVKVNYVWFNDDPLSTSDKFNVYSWRALGHEVTIYAHRWDGTPHNEGSLGLSGSGVEVKDLSTILAEDDTGRTATLRNTRALLKGWIEATNKEKPSITAIYNMVDLTKSYIGGTRQGIVLDLKVGPSPHLAAYEAAFSQKFVSYTRGGNTAERPENQCIGTMQEADTIRGEYAKAFERNITANLDGDGGLRTSPDGTHFNLITSFHGRGFNAAKPNIIDVATKTPEGKPVGNQYVVEEIGQPGHGPFRVFKAAADQTNKSSGKTKPEQVVALCQQVWDNELKGKVVPNEGFLAEVEALKLLPGWKAR